MSRWAPWLGLGVALWLVVSPRRRRACCARCAGS